MTMGIVAHSGVLRDAAALQNQGVIADQPVMTTASARPGTDFSLQVVELMQAVYSYGGGMLFIEIMAEMRHPWDFWKGMLFAQAFIYFSYIFSACSSTRTKVSSRSTQLTRVSPPSFGRLSPTRSVLCRVLLPPSYTEMLASRSSTATSSPTFSTSPTLERDPGSFSGLPLSPFIGVSPSSLTLPLRRSATSRD